MSAELIWVTSSPDGPQPTGDRYCMNGVDAFRPREFPANSAFLTGGSDLVLNRGEQIDNRVIQFFFYSCQRQYVKHALSFMD